MSLRQLHTKFVNLCHSTRMPPTILAAKPSPRFRLTETSPQHDTPRDVRSVRGSIADRLIIIAYATSYGVAVQQEDRSGSIPVLKTVWHSLYF